MQPFHPKSLLVPVIAGIIGLILYLNFRIEVSPKSSVDIRISRSEAETKAKNILKQLGYSVEGLSIETSFNVNAPVQNFLVEKFGTGEAQRVIVADTVVTHRWQVYFYDAQASNTRMVHQYRVWLTQTGEMCGYNHIVQDTASGDKLSLDSAKAIAHQFLKNISIDNSGYYIKKSTTTNLAKRTDHTIIVAEKDSAFDAPLHSEENSGAQARTEITIRIQGSEVGYYSKEFVPPQDFVQKVNEGFSLYAILAIISYLIIFFLVVAVISLFLKKYHEGEVGVKTALVIAGFLFVLIAVTTIIGYESVGYGVQMGDTNRTFVKLMLFVITLFIVYGFLTAMTFAAWSVGESSARLRAETPFRKNKSLFQEYSGVQARQGWGIKLSGIDSLIQRKPFTANVAYSILWGYGTGFGLLGFLIALYYAISKYAGAAISSASLGGVPEAYSQSIYCVFMAIVGGIISEITLRLLIVSWMREKTKKVWLGVLVSSLIWTFTAIALWDIPFGYFRSLWQFVIFFIVGAVLCIIFLRYGILSSIIASSILASVGLMEPILFSSGETFLDEKILFGIFMFAPIVVSVVGLIRKEEFHFTADTMPTHIKRISERERMAKELEIARNVQMSLLPKENPHIAGFDIAGICIPAYEVGGDYYDFVNLGENKIGIAIGDVSGKGVPAAIYMTLTKGILQSHAEENVSPKIVLSKVNRLMYKTIEKNSFVSMFYAIIDLQTKTIRYSRAGHNPVILVGLREDKHEFLTPKGVALGLDDGGVFDSVLEEREYKLREGDLLVFYTDGFTEARNNKGEEFGESRLLQSVARAKEKFSEHIINTVVYEAKRFIGDAQQHDDMTMVVVKVG